MKLKKLLSITLLSIPFYFFTPNIAKAEEFKINLKNPGIKTEQTDCTKKDNIFNDLDTKSFVQNIEEFVQKTDSRIEQRIYEERFLLDIRPETRYFLFNWENVTKHMSDMEKKFYMEGINKDIKKTITKEFKKEAQEEFRESKFYEWFKEELGYYKEKVRGRLEGEVSVKEKKAYIDNEGGINLGYKKEEFRNLPNEGFELSFRKEGMSIEHKDVFKLNLKAKPLGFHSRSYNPRLELDVVTKYFSIHNKVSYSVVEEKLKASASTSLPKGLILSLDYDRSNKDDDANLTTKLSRRIKDYDLSLSYTRMQDGKTSSRSSIIMFNIEKTW